MQLNAITRKSAFMAIILLVMMLVAVALRYCFTPFAMELADSAFRERIVSLVVAMMIFFGVGIIEGKVLVRSGLSSNFCALPMPLYGVLACGVFLSPQTLTTAAASLCFALAMLLLLRSLHRAGEKDSVLFFSMLLGITVLLYPPCIVLAAVIPVAVFTLALSVRQTILMIIGYLTPLLGASYVMWYRGDSILEFGRNLINALMSSRMDAVEEIPYVAIVIVALVTVVLVWGGIFAAVRPDKMFHLARVRRSLYLFLWVSLVSMTMLLLPSCDLSVCAIVAVPISILLSFVLSILPNNHSTIAYWIILALFVLHLFVE